MKQGVEQGRKEGREEGMEEGLLMAVRSLIEKTGFSVEEALDAIGIPKKDWGKFEKQLV